MENPNAIGSNLKSTYFIYFGFRLFHLISFEVKIGDLSIPCGAFSGYPNAIDSNPAIGSLIIIADLDCSDSNGIYHSALKYFWFITICSWMNNMKLEVQTKSGPTIGVNVLVCDGVLPPNTSTSSSFVFPRSLLLPMHGKKCIFSTKCK